MGLVLVTAPSVEPLTAEEARSRLGLSAEDVPDAVMNALITAARQTIDGRDGWLGRALITQTWKLVLPSFRDRRKYEVSDYRWPTDRYRAKSIRIPLPPTQSLSSIIYTDDDGVETTMDAADYRIVQDGPYSYVEPLFDELWPDTRAQQDAIAITFVAGYGDAGSSVPEPIRSAIALLANHMRAMTARNLFVSSETVDGVGSQSFVVSENAAKVTASAADYLLSGYRLWG